MALTPKEEKELLGLQERKNTQSRINASTQERIDVLLAKQNTKLSEQLKISKSISKAGDDYDKVLKSQEKSLSSILGKLLQGNVAGAIEEGLSKKALVATEKRAKQNKNIQSSLKVSNGMHKQQADFSKLEGANKSKVLDLINGINSGLYNQADVQATLEDLGEKNLSQSSDLGKMLFKFADTADKERVAKEETEASQLRFNKHLGRAGMVFGALLAIANKFASSIDVIGKQFGSLNVLGDGFKNELLSSQEAVVGIGASLEDVVATTNELSSEFGLSLDEAVDLSAQIIDTARAVGLSNEEAAKLSGILQTTSGLSGEQAERLTEGAFQLAAANRVNPSAVLKDMAASSETFAMFSEDGGDNLAKAAVQARALGLSLDTTAKIAEGLLDFESSITAEVEASVLIGRQLNLQKARELALTNDLEGAMTEIVKQVGTEAEFNKLMLPQRQALAKSIGVSVSDLAKMVANQDKSNMLAGETAKSFADIIGKDAMSELTATMNELKIFGVALANTLGPILMGIAKIVNFVLTPIGQAVSGISRSVRGVDDFHTGPGGITTMMGPAGVFSLNPRDSVLATTNPIPVQRVNDMYTSGAGGLGVGGGTMNVNFQGELQGDKVRFLADVPFDGSNRNTEPLRTRGA